MNSTLFRSIMAIVIILAVVVTVIFRNNSTQADSGEVTNTGEVLNSGGTQFMDFIKEMPIVEELTTDCWGSVVGPRDQGNGLEDRENKDYCYWDGKIIRDEDTGKYYLFGSRWAESEGHNGWYGSDAVYATSDNLYGPYTEHGKLWPTDQNGKGHNVWPLKLHDGDPHGKYAIIVSETRDGDCFVSDSLDGPWENIGKLKVDEDYWQSNTCLIARPDGRYEIINRRGDIAISDDLLGTYEVKGRNLWLTVRGMPTDIEKIEDAVVWYCDGLYHCTVNKWDSRQAYYLTSEDGIDDWQLNPGVAYMPDEDFIRYEDGTVNHWNKIERPNVYIEDNEVKAMTFSVIDVPKDDDKGHDSHGSKVIVVPFDGKGQNEFAHANRDEYNSLLDSKSPVADSTAMFGGEDNKLNSGASDMIRVQKNINPSYGLFGEKLSSDDPDKGTCKIGYLKFDLSNYNPEETGKVVLSLIYAKDISGSDTKNSVVVTLADNKWQEGTGKGSTGDEVGSEDMTWDNKPELNYDADNIEVTTAVSEEFGTKDINDPFNNIQIDVTGLIRSLVRNEKYVTFAICEEEGDNCLGFFSKESGVNTPLLNFYPKEEPTPTPTPQPVLNDQGQSGQQGSQAQNPQGNSSIQGLAQNTQSLPGMTSQATADLGQGNSGSLNELKKGDTYKDKTSGLTYCITSASSGKMTVAFVSSGKESKSVTIPSTVSVNGKKYKVTEIKAGAFKNNKKLKKIVIGKNVKKIGSNAFSGCKNLKNVIIKTTSLTGKSVGKNSFNKIHPGAKVKVPGSKIKDYKKLLKEKGLNGKKQKVVK